MAGTPQDIAANWASRLAQSGDKITKGVQAVTVAPGQAAARQADVWANNTVASKDKWRTRVAGVTLQEWQQAIVNKGVPRIASGAQASQGKFADFMTRLLPHIDSVKGTLPARGTLDQNIDRMVRFSRGMAQFKG